jgi:hypothetical protein
VEVGVGDAGARNASFLDDPPEKPIALNRRTASASVVCDFNGSSTTSVRDYIRQKVTGAFTACNFESEVFVVVGRERHPGDNTATDVSFASR